MLALRAGCKRIEMTRPGFRKGRSVGARPGSSGAGDGFLSSSLFSQAQILHLMKSEFARSRRHGQPMACLVLQVDRLPQLVDLHGASLRQAVRQALAELVRQKTRGSDLLGVASDDRYLLVLPHTDVEAGRVVADRLHRLFGELDIAVDGRQLALSLSVGLSASGEQRTMFFDTLVAEAEAAADFAGAQGGDRVCSFGEMSLMSGDGAGEGSPPDPSQRPGDGAGA